MSTKSKVSEAPQLFIQTGKQALAIRNRLAQNQTEFWSRLAVAQSGGSRFESGGNIPHPVQILLHLAYAPEAQAQTMLSYIRNMEPKKSGL